MTWDRKRKTASVTLINAGEQRVSVAFVQQNIILGHQKFDYRQVSNIKRT